jgi:hypothetical protein
MLKSVLKRIIPAVGEPERWAVVPDGSCAAPVAASTKVFGV